MLSEGREFGFELQLHPRGKEGEALEQALDIGVGALEGIEAELWAQPVPLRMFMKTEVDLEIGNITLTEKSESRRR